MGESAPLIDVGAFDRVEASGEANRFVEWMTYQRRRGSDPMLELLCLVDGDVVLDVGCGPGVDLMTMSRSVAFAVGVDLSHAMAAAASTAVSDSAVAHVVVSDGQRLPFERGSFTAANCRAVLIHNSRPDGAVAEIARVLAPGGRALFCEPDHGSHIVASPEQDVFVRVLAHRRTTFRSPQVGRDLPGLIAAAGLELDQVIAVPIVYRSFAAARAAGGPFDVAVRGAVEAGAISVAEADRYLGSLEELDERGAFFFAAMSIVALARKPGDSPTEE